MISSTVVIGGDSTCSRVSSRCMRWLTQSLSSIRTDVPRPVRTLQLGGLLNAFGNGLVLPFLIIYLHNVRGISLGLSGLIVGTNSAVVAGRRPGVGAAGRSLRAAPRCCAWRWCCWRSASPASPSWRPPGRGLRPLRSPGIGNGGFWPSQSTLLAATDRTLAATVGVLGAADHDEPGDRVGRCRRRPDRLDHAPRQLPAPVRRRRAHLRRCSRWRSRGCRRWPRPTASTAPRAGSAMCCDIARSWR